MNDARHQRLLKRTAEKMSGEAADFLEQLRARPDYHPLYEYFLELAADLAYPAKVSARCGRPLMNLICIQAPLELIHAAGFQPFKLFCGSFSAGNLAAKNLPALVCPMLRSTLGAMLTTEPFDYPWVLPTTCDWVVKLPEMMELVGVTPPKHLHWLELPHFKKNPKSQMKWLDEIYSLKQFLEKISGGKIRRQNIAESIFLYRQAWRRLVQLSVLRSEGRISSIWFLLIINTFLAGRLEWWSEKVEKLMASLPHRLDNRPRVFLSGSPIFYPNFKLLRLIEEAELNLVADDLCSSERFFPGGINSEDSSEAGQLESLAQRYHQGCLCPTFSDNERRVNNIFGQKKSKDFAGVIFAVLKGCHPYDLESYSLEMKLKERDLSFIRLEIDYTAEDSQNLLTRLEAFRQTLR